MRILVLLMLSIGSFCFSFLLYDFMNQRNHWRKISKRIAISLCVGMYVVSTITFFNYLLKDNYISLKIPVMVFSVACVLLIAILRGKFSSGDST